MARKKTKGARAPTYSLPAFELVPVQEDAISGNERRQFVTELLARMYVSSKKRGRPKKTTDEDETYAA